MNEITNWKIRTKHGYIYCTGLFEGRPWVTSDVVKLVQKEDHYVVFTENSIYHLYW